MFKKITFFMMTFLALFAIVGCQMNQTQNEEKYVVTFYDENDLQISEVEVLAGDLLEAPEVLDREGYQFLGWYNGYELWDFENDTVSEDLVLKAKWEEINEHVHDFVDGKCGCGEEDPNYVPPHEHEFIDGKCECGEDDPNYVPPHEHVFVDGKCECGEIDPDYEPVLAYVITYNLNGGSWSWSAGSVSSPKSGIDSVSNLPEIFMADFYTYLFDNDLLNSPKVSSELHVYNWAGFSAKYGDPVAWYNATSTGGYGAADGYSELFFNSVNGYEAVGGFLGTSPYKEKYANLTKHAIQLTTARYSMATTSASFKGAMGFVLDGYFYGTQGLLASSNSNHEVFNALRAVIPTPTVGYEGSTSTTNDYAIFSATVGTKVKLVAPVKAGHMFLGWYDNPQFNGDPITSVSSAKMLYAKWFNLNGPARVYHINYVLNGGTNSDDAPTQFNQGYGVELTIPTKEGYTFVGWSKDSAGKNIITEISPLEKSDVTLYANWIEEEDKYVITYNYSEGKLPTYNPTSIEEVAEYVFTSYYNWLKPSDNYDTFKTKVIAQWKDGQSQGSYKFYKQNGKDTIDDSYFCNAAENFEEWNAWFTVFDSLVTAANSAQNAWNSYVGILRLGQVLSGNPPVTWKADFNTTLCAATNITIPLVSEYKLGDEFKLTELVIDDGRTFLGWYDQDGNKVEYIYANTEGDLVLTAKWSEATPVESFTITNPISELLKYSAHQLEWEIGPTNATYQKVTFRSSNTNVLTVSDKGLLEARAEGSAIIYVTVHGNTSLNTEFEVEVYIDPFIDGEFVDKSYVVISESIQLRASLVAVETDLLLWKSNTPDIAYVSSDGEVTGISEGLAEIVVYCSENEDISFTFYVTVLAETPTGLLKLLVDSNNSEVYTKNHLLIGIKIGSDGAYYSDIVGSVSKLLFEDYAVYDDYYLANPSNKSSYNGDGIGGVDFITVHYAADMPYAPSATFNGGKNLASYNKSCNTNGTQASWHYSVGNDGIWACQNEAYGAWHAGASKKMTWVNSGVTTNQVGTDLYTTDVKMGSDGYFYIKGVKTTVKNTSAGSKLNGMGLGIKVVGSTVYLGGHYQNTSYNYISSTGGNNNSIGMETSVREGSDLWLTWQYTAQLCAKLLIKYQLPLNRLVGHHFFSGKWCPQPMLENDLEIWREFVELTRQQMDLYQNYGSSSMSFASSSSYLKDNGRVSVLPDYPECVTYTVTYNDGQSTKTITLSSILPGALE